MITAKTVHIIGVGGIGTSAVARWWKGQGATVSGSDMHTSAILEDLDEAGIEVKIGHFADNIPRDCDLVIYSAAVPATNVERQVANERGIKEWSYPKFLGKLAAEKKTIAVSGTNGKSTTTAMIAGILIEAGYDPTVILGTKVPDWPEKNLRIGKSDWFVVEACEHMANMLSIHPNTAVITNIEEDHLDYYRDLSHIRDTFQQWIDCKDTCSQVVLNRDDAESQKLDAKYVSWFGVDHRKIEDGGQTFDVAGVPVILHIPGAFNAQNAAAALTAAHVVGVPDEPALKALADFKGTWRRFEHVGMWTPTSLTLRGAGSSDVYSDYAHHPTACAGSIAAFKEFFPDRRLVVVFEPHQHSRTTELFDEFVTAFDDADVLLVSEIYEVAGRTESKQISSKDLVEKIQARGTVKDVRFTKDQAEAEAQLASLVAPQDVIVLMGAGSIDELARKLTQ